MALELDRPAFDLMLGGGFRVLVRDEPRSLVVGIIGRPWESHAQPVSFDGPEGFLRFAEPGYVKIAFSFSVGEAPKGMEVVSVVRVLCTDPATRRKFRRYWFVIGTGSWLARWAWLRAVARKVRQHGVPNRPQ